jgi:hypothetical protein
MKIPIRLTFELFADRPACVARVVGHDDVVAVVRVRGKHAPAEVIAKLSALVIAAIEGAEVEKPS